MPRRNSLTFIASPGLKQVLGPWLQPPGVPASIPLSLPTCTVQPGWPGACCLVLLGSGQSSVPWRTGSSALSSDFPAHAPSTGALHTWWVCLAGERP